MMLTEADYQILKLEDDPIFSQNPIELRANPFVKLANFKLGNINGKSVEYFTSDLQNITVEQEKLYWLPQISMLRSVSRIINTIFLTVLSYVMATESEYIIGSKKHSLISHNSFMNIGVLVIAILLIDCSTLSYFSNKKKKAEEDSLAIWKEKHKIHLRQINEWCKNQLVLKSCLRIGIEQINNAGNVNNPELLQIMEIARSNLDEQSKIFSNLIKKNPSYKNLTDHAYAFVT
ncbi:MAG: hypothetical protein H0W88_05040 [Parachlamydiaceae bacterium]|nr:hypothetical protein [Parachlamydiaceae bacterium]